MFFLLSLHFNDMTTREEHMGLNVYDMTPKWGNIWVNLLLTSKCIFNSGHPNKRGHIWNV